MPENEFQKIYENHASQMLDKAIELAAMKILLMKYIRYVRDCEGTDFILTHDRRFTPEHPTDGECVFTDKEWNTLIDLAKPIKQ